MKKRLGVISIVIVLTSLFVFAFAPANTAKADEIQNLICNLVVCEGACTLGVSINAWPSEFEPRAAVGQAHAAIGCGPQWEISMTVKAASRGVPGEGDNACAQCSWLDATSTQGATSRIGTPGCFRGVSFAEAGSAPLFYSAITDEFCVPEYDG